MRRNTGFLPIIALALVALSGCGSSTEKSAVRPAFNQASNQNSSALPYSNKAEFDAYAKEQVKKLEAKKAAAASASSASSQDTLQSDSSGFNWMLLLGGVAMAFGATGGFGTLGKLKDVLPEGIFSTPKKQRPPEKREVVSGNVPAPDRDPRHIVVPPPQQQENSSSADSGREANQASGQNLVEANDANDGHETTVVEDCDDTTGSDNELSAQLNRVKKSIQQALNRKQAKARVLETRTSGE